MNEKIVGPLFVFCGHHIRFMGRLPLCSMRKFSLKFFSGDMRRWKKAVIHPFYSVARRKFRVEVHDLSGEGDAGPRIVQNRVLW